MALWDKDFLDMAEAACLAFDSKAGASLFSAALPAASAAGKRLRAQTSLWMATTKWMEASGDSWAELLKDGSLKGEIHSAMVTFRASKPSMVTLSVACQEVTSSEVGWPMLLCLEFARAYYVLIFPEFQVANIK